MNAPRRRWFRFPLRTMMVVVTLTGCSLGWLAWQLAIIHQRRTEIERIESSGGKVLASVPFYASDHFSGRPLSDFETPRLPLVRRMLGDRPVGMIRLPSADLDASECQSLRAIFPELVQISSAPQIIQTNSSQAAAEARPILPAQPAP